MKITTLLHKCRLNIIYELNKLLLYWQAVKVGLAKCDTQYDAFAILGGEATISIMPQSCNQRVRLGLYSFMSKTK